MVSEFIKPLHFNLMPTKLSLEHDSYVRGFNANKKPIVIKKRSNLEGLHKNKFPIDITLAEITVADLQILSHESNSESSNKLIEQALFSSKSLICTIDDIIEFSKIEGDKLFIEESIFSLKRLLQTLINDMQHEVKKKKIK